VPDDHAKHLTRHLGRLDLFCIAAGAMISSGLFILPGLVYARVGPAAILAYLLAGVFVLPALLAKAELTTAMPKAGGTYFFIDRSMGSAAGTIGGFACWLSLALKSAFALVGIGAFAALLHPDLTIWHIKLIAVVFCVLFIVLNLVSVRLTSRVQNVLVLSLLALLILYILRGSVSVHAQRYTPFLPYGPRTLFAAAGLVFISFGGLTKIASVAEEARRPARDIPYAMILAFCLILLAYGLTVFVTVGLVDGPELADPAMRTPISHAASKILGRFGSAVMAVAGILAFVSTANAGILAASRFPMAMSRDQLLPRTFSRVGRRSNTPYVSILVTGAFMLTVIVLLDLETLVKVASTMQIILFMFVLLACIIMRESRILNYKPAFTSPFYPWLHIAGLICYCFLLYAMGRVSLLATGGFIIAGVLWYKVYSRGKAVRKSALIHIVERVTAKEIAGDSLGGELREVLRQRDRIIEDQFDALVRQCAILDLTEPLRFEDFFALVAERLAASLDVDAKALHKALVAREEESTTEIAPGLAIPHVIVDGEHTFGLLVARCEAGITFTEALVPVYAAFVLVGSRDERNFHLRALSAIAQIVQDPSFHKNWLIAKNVDELRDILLLAERRRQSG